MEKVFITLVEKQTVICLYGVTGRSDQGDRTLRSVLPTTEPLSCDQPLTYVRSALTGHVWSQKLLSRPLLILTEL